MLISHTGSNVVWIDITVFLVKNYVGFGYVNMSNCVLVSENNCLNSLNSRMSEYTNSLNKPFYYNNAWVLLVLYKTIYNNHLNIQDSKLLLKYVSIYVAKSFNVYLNTFQVSKYQCNQLMTIIPCT